MVRPFRFVLFALWLVGAAASDVPGRNTPIRLRTRTFEFYYETMIPALREGAGKLRLWIPLPPSDAHQQISNLTIESPVPYAMHRDPVYGDRYAYLELSPSKRKGPLEIRMRFRATRHENRVDLSDPPPARASLPAAMPGKLELWLKPDRLVPTDGIIGELAQQQTRGLTQTLDKARAIYNYVVATMRYDKSGQGWGRGDALYACNVRKGNCTDFHSLFIGMMRAAGIPAQFEIGFPLPTDRHDGEIAGYHCWARFYLHGIGWVPVDASEAWKNPARREYYFGTHDPDRVLFSRGRDIRFNPAQDGVPVNYFIYPYAELDGKPFTGVKYKFSFRDLENKPR